MNKKEHMKSKRVAAKVITVMTLCMIVVSCYFSYSDILSNINVKVKESEEESTVRMCNIEGCTREAKPNNYMCEEHVEELDRRVKEILEKYSKEEKQKANETTAAYATGGNSKKHTGSSNKKHNSSSGNSYDEGYEDVFDNDDYDWDRYFKDDDYADGVDDALDEYDD